MGLCPKRIIFKKRDSRKGTNGRNVKENQIVNWINFKKEAIRTRIVTEKVEGKWIGEKKYWATKIIVKIIDIKEAEIGRGWETEGINWERKEENARPREPAKGED